MFKRILLIVSLMLSGIGIATFFIWQQAMQLPSWYTESSSKENVIAVNKETKKPLQTDEILRKVSDNLTAKTAGEVELDASEINSLIATSLTKKNNIAEFAPAIKGTNTEIKNGKISVGAVIEASSIPVEKLSAREQKKVIQLINNLSGEEKPIYIGIEGKPRINNQELSFDDTTRIYLGNLSFSIDEVSQNLGIPKDSINQLISQEIKKLPIKLESINIEDERLIVRGYKNKM